MTDFIIGLTIGFVSGALIVMFVVWIAIRAANNFNPFK